MFVSQRVTTRNVVFPNYSIETMQLYYISNIESYCQVEIDCIA